MNGAGGDDAGDAAGDAAARLLPAFFWNFFALAPKVLAALRFRSLAAGVF